VLIGSEQGFLAAPQKMNLLILGPGERADVLVDFAENAGKELFLRTNVALILQFRVGAKKAADSSVVPANLRPIRRLSENDATVKRDLTVADYQHRLGRSSVMLLNGAHWSMPVTEKPVLNSTEIWSFLNLTDDSHPIHLHLVRFQVLDRRPFDLATYQLTKKIVYTGPAGCDPGAQ
jgi:spore coat protein A